MTTATMQRKTTTALESPTLRPEDLFDALFPDPPRRFIPVESGRTSEPEVSFVWCRVGRWEVLERDPQALSAWLAPRIEQDPRVALVPLVQNTIGSPAHPSRVLWGSVPIATTPLGSPAPSQYRNSLERLDVASEREAFGRLLGAPVAPSLLAHQGRSLTGLWLLDRAIAELDDLKLAAHQLSRRLGATQPLGQPGLVLLPCGQVASNIIPRFEPWVRWNGTPGALVPRDQMDAWLWDGLDRPKTGGPLTARQQIIRARPY